jgi:hypothetical protein
MKTALVTISGISPYSQSKFVRVDKLEKESASAYEERNWRERLHVDEQDNVIIPPMAFKNCLAEAAKYLSIQIPGKGKATYTKHFEAGVLVVNPLVLNLKKQDVAHEWLFVPSDGKRGGGTRVQKCFPVIHAEQWGGEVEFLILDETVDQKIFEHVIREAGRFIGIGRFRPRNNGYYGRFDIKKIKWS